ncbi:DinB family protein [Streptomyces sp. NBC_01511]|uniref:DinB family protein n=1 Tax=Streptomyces sp. NBC_01511 TaxID=2903889 RepID=UPI003867E466
MTTTVPRVDLLVRQLDMVWALFEYYQKDLTDQGCLWEPSPDCWTVRPNAEGDWVADWQVPEPDPVPSTSIGWLTWHIGYWWTTTLTHCFGAGAPPRESIHWPGTADTTTAWLHSLKDSWRTELLQLTDAELDSTDRTKGLPWGENVELVHVASWLNFELAKNVAEIGLVQRTYQASTRAAAAHSHES